SPAPIIQFRVSSGPLPVSLPLAVEAPTDHDLMIAVRAGEIRRLGDLFERHHRQLYGFFVRLTNQPAVSEDLVQIVFYRILKYRHTYRDEGKFSAWIYHLARKVAADHFRRRSTAPVATDPDDLHAVPDHAPHAAERAAAADDTARLHAALAALDPEQRELLVLARFQRLKHEELARLFDTSVGAVKVRVHRALKNLRDVYFKLSHEQPA
ncbi:MAG TPA: RNA polymerase sigma factor, partial [Opitutaceae bacterium]|nr:RNA polymerase sigma factor [Opitutaceae bacterium]